MNAILKHVLHYKKQLIIIVILTLLQIFASLYTPTILATLVSHGVLKNDTTVIYTQGFYMLIASSVDLLLSVVIGLYIAKFAVGLSKDLRLALFNKIQSFSTQDFQTFGTASYIKRLTSDVQTVSNTLGFSMRLMLMAPIMFIGAIMLSLRINFQLSLIMLVTAPLMLGSIFILVKSITNGITALRQTSDKMTQIVHEGLTGIRVIRAFNKEPYELERFDGQNQLFRHIGFSLNVKFGFILPLMMIMVNCSNALVVWFGAGLIEKHQLNIGELMAILQYASLVLIALMLFSMIFIMIPQGIVSARRMNEVFAQDNLLTFETIGQPLENVNSITFDNVSFKYDEAEKSMLTNVSFTAHKGEKIAIIGSTGSGKSTLINLLLRFMDVSSGQLLLNDTNIQQLSEQTLRQHIGFVPQNRNLFAGTIRDNLKFGRLDASDDDMISALKTAQAWEFVSNLDGQLDARVEQRGENFSGGQKQRLAIARALVKKADILIFDDSFSALDAKTEALLRQSLKPLAEQAIVFVVAQRISSVVDAHKIIVLNEGNVVGMGTHEQLAKTNTVYREIMASQLNQHEMEAYNG